MVKGPNFRTSTIFDNYPKNKNGWVVDFDFMPDPYSIIYLLLDDGKKVLGWWQGDTWYSRRLGSRKVVGWKKHLGEY